ncbi:hypothetical protein GpartN1_g6463.t1 [Galdieria partita]|uniref:Uncharacterized protein n=1 Tax=Galdieria partita TaxID=83374 RepID=A0A9C7Q329_9RHOD|nr:hypothetical protein GpartN1_g6463.t1 [Galdieria partita]
MDTFLIFDSTSQRFGVAAEHIYDVNDNTKLRFGGKVRHGESDPSGYFVAEYDFTVSKEDFPINVRARAICRNNQCTGDIRAKKKFEVDEDTSLFFLAKASTQELTKGSYIIGKAGVTRDFRLGEDTFRLGAICDQDGNCRGALRNQALGINTNFKGDWNLRLVISKRSKEADKLFFD